MEIEECLERLLDAADLMHSEKNTEIVDLCEAEGRVCARDIFSEMMVPPFPKSAMDGYAVRTEEVLAASRENPVRLKVLGELCAGDYVEHEYQPLSAVRVMTGAYVPQGFDAVIRQEDTDYGMDEVQIFKGVPPYGNYCKAGEDIEMGQLLVPARTRLTPLHIGLLASVGHGKVEVVKPVTVAILSTGTELCTVGQELAPGKIYNNIAYILQAAIRREGMRVVSVETCADETGLLENKLKAAAGQAQIIITTGAVSVGKKDIIPEVTERLGARVLFRRANIQPGTPTMASSLEGRILLNLSGNPYAALANFEIYFWPLVAKMMNNASYEPVVTTAVLDCEYHKANKMRRLLRAYASGGKVTMPSGVHASSVIHNLVECNCFIDLEAGRVVECGDVVTVRFCKYMGF